MEKLLHRSKRWLRSRRGLSAIIGSLMLVSTSVAMIFVVLSFSSTLLLESTATTKINVYSYTKLEPDIVIYIQVSNSGSRDVVLDTVYLNGEPVVGAQVVGEDISLDTEPYRLEAGSKATIRFPAEDNLKKPAASGQTVSLAVHVRGYTLFSTMLVLP